jgi:hypothetical protein
VLQILLDIVPVELRDETLDLFAVLEFRWVRCLLFDSANFSVELSDVEKVATTAAVLAFGQYRVALLMSRATCSCQLPSLILSNLASLAWRNFNRKKRSWLHLLWLCKHGGGARRSKDCRELHDGGVKVQQFRQQLEAG